MLEWPDLTLPPINLWTVPKQFWIDNMSLTLEDVKEKLKTMPEVDLMEVLELTSEDIVNRFPDVIEERLDYFIEDLEDD